jgi:hypothetical protein
MGTFLISCRRWPGTPRGAGNEECPHFHAVNASEESRRSAGAKRRVRKRADLGADARGSDVRELRRVRHADAARAARHAEERCGRCALSAELSRLAGQAVGVGFQVGIGMRLHAELGDEQRQRQQLNDQATTTSEQDSNLRAAQVSAESPLSDNPGTSSACRQRNVWCGGCTDDKNIMFRHDSSLLCHAEYLTQHCRQP